MPENKKIYVPKQHVRRGVAGYRGANVVVVDDGSFEQKPAEVVKPAAKDKDK